MSIKIDLYLIISMAVLIFFKQIEPFLTLYIFIIFHEIAHILVAILLKIKVLEINFLPFGANAKFDFSNHFIKEIIVASSGPIFSLGMAYLLKDFRIHNLFILITNMLPIYPLDGGRISKNIMILFLGEKRGVKFYNNLLTFLIIVLIIINIIFVVFFKNYRFIFVCLYIIQIAEEEIKKDKFKSRIKNICMRRYALKKEI